MVDFLKPIIIGIFVGVLLYMLNINMNSILWWVLCLIMNIVLNVISVNFNNIIMNFKEKLENRNIISDDDLR
jgi:hypothetical protein